MRNFRIRRELDIDRVEHDSLSVRRNLRRPEAFHFHHVLERERMFRARVRRLPNRRRRNCKKESQEFPVHVLPPMMKRKTVAVCAPTQTNRIGRRRLFITKSDGATEESSRA